MATNNDVTNEPGSEPVSEPAGAIANVLISPDGMRAELTLSAPQEGGPDLSAEDIRTALESFRVTYGIDMTLVEALAKSPQYEKAYVVAKGVEAVDGTPAQLAYEVELGRDLKPKENPDGSVDYKDLGLIQNVREGDVLCIKTPATPGSTGYNVLGVELKPVPGKDAVMPMGKNTVLSEDELQLMAACDGQVDLIGGKLQILNTYTVTGDVDNATGNINFVGNILVQGNVRAGFTVQAEGNITVNGSAEDATMIAGGNIVLKEGIHGGGQESQRSVQAGGYIKAKYIQNANVKAGGEIESTFIQHSLIQSNTMVNVVGSKSRLTGGRVVARNSINAAFVGGRTSVIPTTLEVGNDPAVIEKHRQLTAQIEGLTNQMNSLQPAIHMLEELEKTGELSEDRLEALNQARSTYQVMEENLSELQTEIYLVNEEMSTLGFGTINIKQSAYPGVRIVIGSEQMILETEYTNTSFVRGSKGLSFIPYME
ncbi:MAG: FapA family protein [Clostridiales bacterium]|nr:FapA family protein [Clostridiales bacterium]